MFQMSFSTWSKRVAQGLLGVALLVVATWAMSRFVGPTKAQEQALATMRRLPPAVGRNAFEALWLLPYDVPESQRGRIVAEDLRRLALPSGGHEWVALAAKKALISDR
jgi:hypothetical protein